MIEAIVRRRAIVYLATLCIVVGGLVTYMFLPREANPDVTIPVVTVTTPYIGVSPEDIETLVTNPLENELAGVKDVKKMTSTSYEGLSAIVIEFEPEVVIADAIQRVRDRVSRARPRLPEDAEDTEVQEISFGDLPIMIVTIAGDISETHLKELGETCEEDVRRINGVLDATLSGGRDREIRIQVDPVRLSHYGLSLNDVVGAVADENVNVPGGEVGAGDASYLLRVPGEIDDPAEIEGIAIKRVGDRPVFIRDVARVVDGFADRTSYARMDGRTALSVAVSKRSGANILELATAVKALAVEHMEGWPEGVSFQVLGDQSKFVNDMVDELENGIITGLLLVIGVLLFFMGVRNSFFVALAIPLSMLLAFLFIDLFGMTLNMIVLFALIMALGMLVDNAIVIVENVFRHVEEGEDRVVAAIEGTKEVAGAVAASTATTVAAFAPLLFWTGIMGQFMGYLPKTIVIVLICSLAVAVGILPVFLAKMMRRAKHERHVDDVQELERPMRLYKAFLERAMRRKAWAIGGGFATLVATLILYCGYNHGVEFFPETEPNRATITVRAPIGTELETTDRIVRRLEAMLAAEANVDVFVAEVGVAGGGQDPMAASQAAANMARITVDFLPDRNTAKDGEAIRVEKTTDTIDRLRDRIAGIPGAEIRVEKERMGPPVGKPVDVRVTGDDVHELGAVAARVRRELRAINGVTGLGDDYRVGRPEMRLRIDRGAAKRVGASTRAVAGIVRAAVAGQKASALRDGDDEHDIVVELAPEHRDNLESVLALRIDGREDTSPDTFPVPLSTVARYELAGGTGAIHHIDQDRVVSITGDVQEGVQPTVVQAAVLEYIDQAQLPAGYDLELGGSNDEQEETGIFLLRALVIGMVLILAVLVWQFNSLSTPIVIVSSVILSLIGVFWGLMITGTPFGIMMTGLGVISLAGIVVNNAIVLLDYVEQLRSQGVPLDEALVQAGMTRFRPVMLTAVTTVLGLVPMALGVNVDFFAGKLILGSTSASFWGPMAVAIIFGLVVATVLTLVVVPTMYGALINVRDRIFAPTAPEPQAAAPAE